AVPGRAERVVAAAPNGPGRCDGVRSCFHASGLLPPHPRPRAAAGTAPVHLALDFEAPVGASEQQPRGPTALPIRYFRSSLRCLAHHCPSTSPPQRCPPGPNATASASPPPAIMIKKLWRTMAPPTSASSSAIRTTNASIAYCASLPISSAS